VPYANSSAAPCVIELVVKRTLTTALRPGSPPRHHPRERIPRLSCRAPCSP
jgi:hypothetical protein